MPGYLSVERYDGLWTLIVPPCLSTICLTTDIPKPEPSKPECLILLALKKSIKILSISPVGIPTPLSQTIIIKEILYLVKITIFINKT